MQKNACWIGNRVLDAQLLLEEFRSVLAAGMNCGTLEEKLFPGCYSPELTSLVRSPWVGNPGSLLWQTLDGKKLLEYLARLSEPMVVVTYAPNQVLEILAQQNPNLKLTANSMKLHHQVDSKFFLISHFSDLCPESFLQAANQLNFAEIKTRLGLPFLVQLEQSIGGDGTFIIASEDSFTELTKNFLSCNHQVVVRLIKFITGPSFNINAVVLVDPEGKTKVIVSAPSVQLVGMSDCTKEKTKYCGNDFTAMKQYPESVLKEILKMTKLVGKALGKLGYRGIFGLDLIHDGTRLFLLEINPRFQGSTPLLHRLESAQKFYPLIRYHLAAFVGTVFPSNKEISQANDQALAQLEGCQIYLYNIKPAPVKIRLNQSRGISGLPLELNFKNQIYLDFALPQQPVTVAPELPLTRAYSCSKAFSSINSSFTDDCQRVRTEIDRLLLE